MLSALYIQFYKIPASALLNIGVAGRFVITATRDRTAENTFVLDVKTGEIKKLKDAVASAPEPLDIDLPELRDIHIVPCLGMNGTAVLAGILTGYIPVIAVLSDEGGNLVITDYDRIDISWMDDFPSNYKPTNIRINGLTCGNGSAAVGVVAEGEIRGSEENEESDEEAEEDVFEGELGFHIHVYDIDQHSVLEPVWDISADIESIRLHGLGCSSGYCWFAQSDFSFYPTVVAVETRGDSKTSDVLRLNVADASKCLNYKKTVIGYGAVSIECEDGRSLVYTVPELSRAMERGNNLSGLGLPVEGKIVFAAYSPDAGLVVGAEEPNGETVHMQKIADVVLPLTVLGRAEARGDVYAVLSDRLMVLELKESAVVYGRKTPELLKKRAI